MQRHNKGRGKFVNSSHKTTLSELSFLIPGTAYKSGTNIDVLCQPMCLFKSIVDQ